MDGESISIKVKGTQNVDHIAFAVEHEKSEEICAWYTAQFGFIRPEVSEKVMT